ncbi:MAG: DUF3108 domain-containing protein [Nitrospinota bacterium]
MMEGEKQLVTAPFRLMRRRKAVRVWGMNGTGSLTGAAESAHAAKKGEASVASGERVRAPGAIRSLAAALASLLFISLAPPPSAAAEPISFPEDEDFTYNIRFLWFKRVAQGRLRIHRVSGRRYRAELLAETKGLIGFLTFHQKNHYVSEADYVPESGRLITRRFTKVVTRGRKVAKSVTEIDYESGEFRWMATENREVKDKGSEPIPEGVIYEDMLSAFFNLRHGAFGPLTRGRRVSVSSLPYYQATEKGQTEYEKEFIRSFEIRIADAQTEKAYRRRFGRPDEKGLLVLVQMPRDLFGQKAGEILVWFDTDLIPIAARVEDVIFLGDVSGVLRQTLAHSPTGVGGSLPKSVAE